jgi:glutamyl-tRNA reductase
MLILLGTNHRSAPVTFRERMAFAEDRVGEELDALQAMDGVRECMILSTCNRVEILVRTSGERSAALELLRGFVERRSGIAREELARYSYHHFDRDAVRHLLKVATGLDSMILGEPQILGQVRNAYHEARARGTTGILLERLLQHCLGVAKRLRTETGISRHAVSVAYAAVGLASKVFGALRNRRALILGAGKMGVLLAKHLQASGVAELVVASRTYNHAAESARRFGGTPVHWDDALARLGEMDIVVSCTGAPQVILHKKDVAGALRKRRREPVFMIDIAVPRDIDPAVNDLDDVYLFDIDALQGVVDANMADRRKSAELALRKVEDEVEQFDRWQRGQEVVPAIVALRETMLGLGERELERVAKKLSSLDDQESRAVQALVRGLIQKILHKPIRYLNGAASRRDVAESVALYQEIFGLEALADGLPEGREPAPRAAGKERSRSEPQADDASANLRQGPQRLIKGGNS